MGKTFNKGLEKADRKKGLLEWLKNIESKNEKQLKAIKNQEEKQILILTNKTLQPEKIEKSTLKMYLSKINWILNQQESIMKLSNKIKRLII